MSSYLLKTLLLCIGLIVVWAISGCALYDLNEFMEETDQQASEAQKPNKESGIKKLSSSKSQITLAWDRPSGDIASYRVYYREHGAQNWEYLGENIGADETEYTISYAVLTNGSYDFAVSVVDSEDTESPLHTSLDTTADPDSGWYLKWEM